MWYVTRALVGSFITVPFCIALYIYGPMVIPILAGGFAFSMASIILGDVILDKVKKRW